MLKKKILICLVLAIVLISACGLLACNKNSTESLRDKCKVAFEYFEDIGREIQFYNIEEFEVSNDNIFYDNKNYFDEGKCYKITLYNQNGSNVRWWDYFFGKLDGEDVLYVISEETNYYNLIKIDMQK